LANDASWTSASHFRLHVILLGTTLLAAQYKPPVTSFVLKYQNKEGFSIYDWLHRGVFSQHLANDASWTSASHIRLHVMLLGTPLLAAR
jgi:hypothetical protein